MLNDRKQKKIKRFKKILVTGGEGAIGSYISDVFKNSDVTLTTKGTLDVTKKSQVLTQVKKHNPDLIIHLAALTNVDFCEQNKSMARRVNFGGTKNIALVCKKFNIPLVYISTATVFDGKIPPKGGYTEDDIPSPVNVYGKTKLLGEEVVKKNLTNYIIMRIGWLVGGRKNDKFFISYMSKKILRGEPIFAVNDIFGTLAHARDMLRFIKEKLEQSETGLFHFASRGVCSRYDIALVLGSILNPKIAVTPVSAQSFEKEFPAPRPKYQVIRSKKYVSKQSWKTILKDYIRTAYLQ